jgi:HSP20 family protein
MGDRVTCCPPIAAPARTTWRSRTARGSLAVVLPERGLHAVVGEENSNMATPTESNQKQLGDPTQGQQRLGQGPGAQAQPPQQEPRAGLERRRSDSPVAGRAPSPFLFGPFALMRRLFEDLEQLAGVRDPTGQPGPMQAMFVPQIDVQQRDDRIVVHVDLPGIAPSDLQLRVEDDALVIEGERRSERELDEGGVVRTERVYGRFQRVIPLPDGADAESAEARFANGVLEVTIKTPQRQKGRRIEIRSAGEAPRERDGERQGATDTSTH